jgi:hypothetical protein
MRVLINREEWGVGLRDYCTETKKRKDRMAGSGGEFRHGQGQASMLNSHGFRCCLGFMMNAAGFTDDEISEFTSPQELVDCMKYRQIPEDRQEVQATLVSRLPKGFQKGRCDVNVDLQDELVELNDNPYFSAEVREKLIKEKFAEVGIEVEFVGQYKADVLEKREDDEAS